MRVLHFVESYLQPTETFVYNFIQQSAVGNETCIVAFNILNLDRFPLPEKCSLQQLQGKTAGKFDSILAGVSKYFLRIHKRKLWIEKLHFVIRDFKPDVIHCHFGTMGLKYVEYLETYPGQPPFITNFYGYDASELPKKYKWYMRGLVKLWSETEMVLVEGPAMGERLIRLGAPAEKIELSPIIINVEKYPVRGTYSRSGKQPVHFLLIGRFIEKKGFHIFLKAVGKLLHLLPPFSITFIGNGPMLDDYKKIINDLGYTGNVTFAGMKSLNECINYMVSADVLIHPSLTAANGDSEGGAPTILLEAQAIGIPVISSTHADIPYVMGYDHFLAKEGDVDSLANCILSFIEDERLEEKIEKGKMSVRSRHDMKVSQLYRQLLAKFATSTTT